MGSAAAMLTEARKWLGTSGRPNALTRAYASRHGNAFLEVAWCNIAVTEWARRSGNVDAVLPSGDRAYTVWHAQDFQKIKRWYTGTVENLNKARPGDVVFFDWGGSNSIGDIDHVGIIEKVLGGGLVQTIEGNTGDVCKRRVRSASSIAGYGRPAYDSPKPPAPAKQWKNTEEIVKNLPTLKRGARGEDVQSMQHLLMARGQKLARFGADADFGAETEAALKAVTGSKTCGLTQWAKLLRV